MSERAYTTIDKSGWPEGPWQSEPDKIQWTDEETGLPCLIVRHSRSGHWCGYVGVSEGSPAFGLHYDKAHDLFPSYDVHGGLTYAASCQEGDESTSICHIPEPGQPDHVWWLGFDCAHSGDVSPSYDLDFPRQDWESYKDVRYVRRETLSLARQLAALPAVAA